MSTRDAKLPYTSTTFYVWLRFIKIFRAALWLFGAIGSIISASSIIGGGVGYPFIMGGLAFAGVLMPGIVKALQLDTMINEYAVTAGLFKELQGEFRRLANVWSNKPFPEFEAETRKIIEAMNKARVLSLTPPEWCFRLARKKIKNGDYNKDE
ncbi:MAG: hypothetical protein KDG89_11335 [Geminicoccaceae bacterium]|nr:hypothetical protein [Geminicoccaceae bacterium]